jgi:hypothetical protein
VHIFISIFPETERYVTDVATNHPFDPKKYDFLEEINSTMFQPKGSDELPMPSSHRCRLSHRVYYKDIKEMNSISQGGHSLGFRPSAFLRSSESFDFQGLEEIMPPRK